MAEVQSLFENLELRVLIIISTLLQICLILWTHQRKQSSSQPVTRRVWLAVYMAADFTAILCMGGIFHENVNPNPSQDNANKEKYILALWSPFILLHLGGHSKMTAFSLEDSEFWLGHLLRFMFHEGTALIVCILASTEIQLRSLSTILFITGTVKFGERILAIKRGSMTELRSSTFKKLDPGLSKKDMEAIKEIHDDANRRGNPISHWSIQIGRNRASPLEIPSRNEDVKTWCAAYNYFTKNKGLFVDALSMLTEAGRDVEGFADMDNLQHFEIVEKELSFAHDLFYTKTALTHTICGWIVRILSLILISLATGLFVHINKHGFHHLDVRITCGLLIAALIFEVWGFLESLTSNHTIVQVGSQDGDKWRFIEDSIGRLRLVKRTIKGFLCPKRNSIGQFNVLRYGYSDSKSSTWLKKLLDFLELKELWDGYYHTTYYSSEDDSDRMIRIIKGVRTRLNEVVPHGENWTLSLFSYAVKSRIGEMDSAELRKNINKEYEECILIWHIATHLCSETVPVRERPAALQDAMFLSDYMLYLLTVHPSTVSSVATTELTSYRKACAASVQLYNDYTDLQGGGAAELYTKLGERRDILVLDNNRSRDQRNSFLLDGYEVAETLKALDPRGELLFLVWVDVLSYAAYHCKGKCHAEQLGTGGQFLTYVWLFMAQLILDYWPNRAGEIEAARNMGYDEGFDAAKVEYEKQVRDIKAELHGDQNTSEGDGDQNKIEGDQNTSEADGDQNRIEGDQNTSEGYQNRIEGDQNTSEADGDQNTSTGADGDQNKIEGDQNTSEADGDQNRIEGDQNTSEGYQNRIEGDQNTSEADGDQNTSTGADGDQNKIEGDQNTSDADGDQNRIEGDQNTSEGDQNTSDADGDRSTSEADGDQNRIEGDQNTSEADGDQNRIEGEGDQNRDGQGVSNN